MTSMRFPLSRGTRVQQHHPPNGSLFGTPSTSTSVRLTPLGPMPRNDTPCAGGCDATLLARRRKLEGGRRRPAGRTEQAEVRDLTQGGVGSQRRRLFDVFTIEDAPRRRNIAGALFA